jgi:predicted ATPase
MHGLFTYLEDNPAQLPEQPFHELSHGESFLSMIMTTRFSGGGFFVLDEPEAGLSFTAQLTLLGVLADLVAHDDAQLLLATHSPVIAALPGATIMELDGSGMHRRSWSELDVVDHYRRFVDRPEAYLRRVIDP